MYDLTMMEGAGVNTAEFIRCNNRFLQMQRDFLEDLLDFAESCAAKGVELEADKFLLKTMQGLTEYVEMIIARSDDDESGQ